MRAIICAPRRGLRYCCRPPLPTASHRLRLFVSRQLAQHLGANRQDEREAVVPLHSPDRDADQVAALIEHAAARDAGVAVGKAGHQTVGGPLADVAGGENDALGVVVAETEDRVGELVAECGVNVQRRQIEIGAS